MSTLVEKYFPGLHPEQKERFRALPALYQEWNAKINVISRKDIEHLEERHILHSLAIARAVGFLPGTRILDAGTGGGFPGIPLAILFPEAHFVLADSIGKKIRVVQEVASALSLGNVEATQARTESMEGSFDFVTGRAVNAIPEFMKLVRRRISGPSFNSIRNGVLYLKGGEFAEELRGIRGEVTVYPLSAWFAEDFFETKKLIHIICI
jgi:16S rRNA (guanine527-N7)-methyltransferase